jgi:predicted PurR-regulated permease PerM
MTTRLPSSVDVTRTTLAVLFIGGLIAASFWIVRPFLTAFIWATMIVVATWPVLLILQARLWGKRGLAVAVMTVGLLLILVVPFWLAIDTILERTDDIIAWVKSMAAFSIPPAPEWIIAVPVFGAKIAEQWQQFASLHAGELSARLTPYAGQAAGWFAGQAGSVGKMILHFLLTIIIAAILYAKGETAAAGVRRFARRLAGEHGEQAAVLSGKAIRGVALGVGVTAFIQSFLSGIGLAITGVPAAALLTAVIFMLCIAQAGPMLVLVPAVIWLYWKVGTLWGTVLLIWSVLVGGIDNFIRPVLIRKGADLPLLLIFAGVIGGLMAFGIIGIFIGPVVLAVSHTLLKVWVSGEEQDTGPATAEPSDDNSLKQEAEL